MASSDLSPKFSLVEFNEEMGSPIKLASGTCIQIIEAVIQIDLSTEPPVMDCQDIIRSDFIGTKPLEDRVDALNAAFLDQVECGVLGELNNIQIIDEAQEYAVQDNIVVTRLFELHLDFN